MIRGFTYIEDLNIQTNSLGKYIEMSDELTPLHSLSLRRCVALKKRKRKKTPCMPLSDLKHPDIWMQPDGQPSFRGSQHSKPLTAPPWPARTCEIFIDSFSVCPHNSCREWRLARRVYYRSTDAQQIKGTGVKKIIVSCMKKNCQIKYQTYFICPSFLCFWG